MYALVALLITVLLNSLTSAQTFEGLAARSPMSNFNWPAPGPAPSQSRHSFQQPAPRPSESHSSFHRPASPSIPTQTPKPTSTWHQPAPSRSHGPLASGPQFLTKPWTFSVTLTTWTATPDPTPVGKPGGHFSCTGTNFTGDCHYHQESLGGNCHNFPPQEQGKLTSIGPDQGQKCWFFEEEACFGKKVELKFPGTSNLRGKRFDNRIKSWKCWVDDTPSKRKRLLGLESEEVW